LRGAGPWSADFASPAYRKLGGRKDDAMRIAQMNVEEKGGLPPPESKGGCHGA
jgi:hypothetical protein